MHLEKKKILQRLVLAFTTGLFLACAAHISANDAGASTVDAVSVSR
jgi:hypothetical protein